MPSCGVMAASRPTKSRWFRSVLTHQNGVYVQDNYHVHTRCCNQATYKRLLIRCARGSTDHLCAGIPCAVIMRINKEDASALTWQEHSVRYISDHFRILLPPEQLPHGRYPRSRASAKPMRAISSALLKQLHVFQARRC